MGSNTKNQGVGTYKTVVHLTHWWARIDSTSYSSSSVATVGEGALPFLDVVLLEIGFLPFPLSRRGAAIEDVARSLDNPVHMYIHMALHRTQKNHTRREIRAKGYLVS